MATSAPKSPPPKANPISIVPKANMLTPAGRIVIAAETGAAIAEVAADAVVVVVVDAEAAMAVIAAVVVAAGIVTRPVSCSIWTAGSRQVSGHEFPNRI